MIQIGDWVTQYSAGYWQVVGIRDKYAEEDNVTGETQGHKHKTSSCLYNISTKFDIIVR